MVRRSNEFKVGVRANCMADIDQCSATIFKGVTLI